MSDYVLAIDQGTSATKCVMVDSLGRIVAKASAVLGESYPGPGWVEQDADAIWTSVCSAVTQCLAQQPAASIAAVGISTQRESALVWQHADGRALTPLLSWQDQRTVVLRDKLLASGAGPMVRERSGLPLDPMFSALKICWLLDQIDPDRRRARTGEIRVGTVDAFLLARLGAKDAIEVGNASRTQLLNVHSADWDADLLALFNVPRAALPNVVPSLAHHASADAMHPTLAGVPVYAVMADSHSALFAHGAYGAGEVKATMGTGSSVMGLSQAGLTPHPGLCLTVAWDVGRGPVQALEGNIRSAGSTLRWAAELFDMSSDEAATLASGADSQGLCLVPAFSGLGAPYWDAHAVGLISGLTLASNKTQLLAAAVESIAHQVADVLDAMDASVKGIKRLMLDGGPSRNPWLRETLAAFIKRPVVYCSDPELSALGVAHLAGLGVGLWDWSALRALSRSQQETPAAMPVVSTQTARANWALAVARSRLADVRSQ